MPTYDYACKECGHRFEAFQSMTDPVLTTCPKCEQETLQRLIGAGAGLVFKGSGYYLTDYKKSSVPAAENGNGTHAKTKDTPANGTGSSPSATASDTTSAKKSSGNDTA